MEETKYAMRLTLEEWEKVINGLGEHEKNISKLKNAIITEINSQIALINPATSKVQVPEQTGGTSACRETEDNKDCGGTVGFENEDSYNKTTQESDTIGEEDTIKEGENK